MQYDLVIRKYDELRVILTEWAKNNGQSEAGYRFIILAGPPGIGKTMSSRLLLEEYQKRYHFLSASTTAIQAFEDIFYHPDDHVMIDDVGQIFRQEEWINLLRNLGDTTPIRKIRWRTKTHALPVEVEREFEVTCPVLISINQDLPNKTRESLLAVFSRALTIDFDPTRKELLKYLRSYATDTQLIDRIERCHFPINLRNYERALRIKVNNPSLLNKHFAHLAVDKKNKNIKTIIDLMLAHPGMSNEDMRNEYCERTNRSASDYNHKVKKAKDIYYDIIDIQEDKDVYPIDSNDSNKVNSLDDLDDNFDDDPDGGGGGGSGLGVDKSNDTDTESRSTLEWATFDSHDIDWESALGPAPDPDSAWSAAWPKWIAEDQEKERTTTLEEARQGHLGALAGKDIDGQEIWDMHYRGEGPLPDPYELLKQMRDEDADPHIIDPIYVMDVCMGIYDYPYAYYAKNCIGRILGWDYVRDIVVKGKEYWARRNCDLF